MQKNITIKNVEILQVIIAVVVVTVLVLGFFAFHVWFRLYVWPETYLKKEKRASPEDPKRDKKGPPGRATKASKGTKSSEQGPLRQSPGNN